MAYGWRRRKYEETEAKCLLDSFVPRLSTCVHQWCQRVPWPRERLRLRMGRCPSPHLGAGALARARPGWRSHVWAQRHPTACHREGCCQSCICVPVCLCVSACLRGCLAPSVSFFFNLVVGCSTPFIVTRVACAWHSSNQPACC